MSDPVREQHERDGFVSSTPFPQGTRLDLPAGPHPMLEDNHRPPVLGVLLVFIIVFWALVAGILFLR